MSDFLNFEEGEVVQLKSGGPLMTVCRGGNREVYVQWMDQAGNLHGKSVFTHVLKSAIESSTNFGKTNEGPSGVPLSPAHLTGPVVVQ